MMTLAVSACVTSPSSTATDRLKRPAAAHAQALAGDDPEQMRETGLALLVLMEAALGWK